MSTEDSLEQSNQVDDHDNNMDSSSSPPIISSDVPISDEKIEEPVVASESEQTDTTTDNNTIDEISETDRIQSTNMITAEASFTEANSADSAPRSSIARILVKPGQIFRVQVDNEVKEVHGKSIFSLIKY